MLASFKPPLKTLPTPTEVLQIAQETSVLSSVVLTLLGPKDHYEPKQLLDGHCTSHLIYSFTSS